MRVQMYIEFRAYEMFSASEEASCFYGMHPFMQREDLGLQARIEHDLACITFTATCMARTCMWFFHIPRRNIHHCTAQPSSCRALQGQSLRRGQPVEPHIRVSLHAYITPGNVLILVYRYAAVDYYCCPPWLCL
jgi:hypothetical protein